MAIITILGFVFLGAIVALLLRNFSSSTVQRSVNTPVSLNVEITSPENGSLVTSPVDLSFTVTGDMPDGFKPVVVVRDPLGQLWPWLHVQNVGGGDWFLPGVILGTNPDCGRSFTLYTVITNEEVPPSRISTLPGGESHSVTVTKRCKETSND